MGRRKDPSPLSEDGFLQMPGKALDEGPVLPEGAVVDRVMESANEHVRLAQARCERAETDVLDARSRVKFAATEEEKDDAQLAIQSAQKEQRDAIRMLNNARAARARMRGLMK